MAPLFDYLTDTVMGSEYFGNVGHILDTMGIEEVYRQQSVCHMGRLTGYSFSDIADWLSKWFETNEGPKSLRANKYFDAFLNGLIGKNCTKYVPPCRTVDYIPDYI